MSKLNISTRKRKYQAIKASFVAWEKKKQRIILFGRVNSGTNKKQIVAVFSIRTQNPFN